LTEQLVEFGGEWWESFCKGRVVEPPVESMLFTKEANRLVAQTRVLDRLKELYTQLDLEFLSRVVPKRDEGPNLPRDAKTSQEKFGAMGTPGQASTATNGADTEVEAPRALVDAFIERVLQVTTVRITRKDICRVAGYTDSTQFERWQRNVNVTHGCDVRIRNTLKLDPSIFLDRLKGAKQPK
jgi:hypothetical protein